MDNSSLGCYISTYDNNNHNNKILHTLITNPSPSPISAVDNNPYLKSNSTFLAPNNSNTASHGHPSSRGCSPNTGLNEDVTRTIYQYYLIPTSNKDVIFKSNEPPDLKNGTKISPPNFQHQPKYYSLLPHQNGRYPLTPNNIHELTHQRPAYKFAPNTIIVLDNRVGSNNCSLQSLDNCFSSPLNTNTPLDPSIYTFPLSSDQLNNNATACPEDQYTTLPNIDRGGGHEYNVVLSNPAKINAQALADVSLNPETSSPPSVTVEKGSLKDNMEHNRISLKNKLLTRRPVTLLIEQGIMPPLQTPVSIYERKHKLERAKKGDFLKHKIQRRPDRNELVQQHILEDTDVEPHVAETQRALKRARLMDNLNDRLARRPGPLDLVRANYLILPATNPNDISQQLKAGNNDGHTMDIIDDPNLNTPELIDISNETEAYENIEESFDQSCPEDRGAALQSVSPIPNTRMEISQSLPDIQPPLLTLPKNDNCDDDLEGLLISEACAPAPPPLPARKRATSHNNGVTQRSCNSKAQNTVANRSSIISEIFNANNNYKGTGSSSKLGINNNGNLANNNLLIDKNNVINRLKTIKFHEYKGPPPGESADGPAGLSMDGKRSYGSYSSYVNVNSHIISTSMPLLPPCTNPYDLLLRQQKLFLQLQMECQQQLGLIKDSIKQHVNASSGCLPPNYTSNHHITHNGTRRSVTNTQQNNEFWANSAVTTVAHSTYNKELYSSKGNVSNDNSCVLVKCNPNMHSIVPYRHQGNSLNDNKNNSYITNTNENISSNDFNTDRPFNQHMVHYGLTTTDNTSNISFRPFGDLNHSKSEHCPNVNATSPPGEIVPKQTSLPETPNNIPKASSSLYDSVYQFNDLIDSILASNPPSNQSTHEPDPKNKDDSISFKGGYENENGNREPTHSLLQSSLLRPESNVTSYARHQVSSNNTNNNYHNLTSARLGQPHSTLARMQSQTVYNAPSVGGENSLNGRSKMEKLPVGKGETANLFSRSVENMSYSMNSSPICPHSSLGLGMSSNKHSPSDDNTTDEGISSVSLSARHQFYNSSACQSPDSLTSTSAPHTTIAANLVSGVSVSTIAKASEDTTSTSNNKISTSTNKGGIVNAAKAASTQGPKSPLELLTVPELRGELKKRKMIVSGPKPYLLERLKTFEAEIIASRAHPKLFQFYNASNVNSATDPNANSINPIGIVTSQANIYDFISGFDSNQENCSSSSSNLNSKVVMQSKVLANQSIQHHSPGNMNQMTHNTIPKSIFSSLPNNILLKQQPTSQNYLLNNVPQLATDHHQAVQSVTTIHSGLLPTCNSLIRDAISIAHIERDLIQDIAAFTNATVTSSQSPNGLTHSQISVGEQQPSASLSTPVDLQRMQQQTYNLHQNMVVNNGNNVAFAATSTNFHHPIIHYSNLTALNQATISALPLPIQIKLQKEKIAELQRQLQRSQLELEKQLAIATMTANPSLAIGNAQLQLGNRPSEACFLNQRIPSYALLNRHSILTQQNQLALNNNLSFKLPLPNLQTRSSHPYLTALNLSSSRTVNQSPQQHNLHTPIGQPLQAQRENIENMDATKKYALLSSNYYSQLSSHVSQNFSSPLTGRPSGDDEISPPAYLDHFANDADNELALLFTAENNQHPVLFNSSHAKEFSHSNIGSLTPASKDDVNFPAIAYNCNNNNNNNNNGDQNNYQANYYFNANTPSATNLNPSLQNLTAGHKSNFNAISHGDNSNIMLVNDATSIMTAPSGNNTNNTANCSNTHSDLLTDLFPPMEDLEMMSQSLSPLDLNSLFLVGGHID